MLMAEFIKTVPRVEFEPKDKSEKYFTGYYRILGSNIQSNRQIRGAANRCLGTQALI